jgi:predicted GIY-YIG superfamily endonuclease
VTGPAHPTAPGLELLYVGIARDLRKRVLTNHARGGTGQSTLRRALAALLTHQEGYQTRRTSRAVLVAEDEQRLSGWIRDHLQLTWAEHPDPDTVESEAINLLSPPLNQASNGTHPLYAVVRQARARWRRSAG